MVTLLEEENEHRSDMSLVLRMNGSFALAYLLAVSGPRLLPQGIGLRLALGLLAILLLALFVRSEIHALHGSDELHRRIRLEGMAIAYPSSLLLIVTVVVFQRLLGIPVEWGYRSLLVLLPLAYYAGLRSARKRYA